MSWPLEEHELRVIEQYGNHACLWRVYLEGLQVSSADEAWACCISLLGSTGIRHICQHLQDMASVPVHRM